jgi:hypothetical protein
MSHPMALRKKKSLFFIIFHYFAPRVRPLHSRLCVAIFHACRDGVRLYACFGYRRGRVGGVSRR